MTHRCGTGEGRGCSLYGERAIPSRVCCVLPKCAVPVMASMMSATRMPAPAFFPNNNNNNNNNNNKQSSWRVLCACVACVAALERNT